MDDMTSFVPASKSNGVTSLLLCFRRLFDVVLVEVVPPPPPEDDTDDVPLLPPPPPEVDAESSRLAIALRVLSTQQ